MNIHVKAGRDVSQVREAKLKSTINTQFYKYSITIQNVM